MKYRVIVADPPWQCDNRLTNYIAGEFRVMPYETLANQDIIDLRVGDLADETCMLALWTTSSHLLTALECAKSWGFKFKSTMCWLKTQADGQPAFGMGQYVRGSHEILLLCTKGACRKALRSRSERSGVISPRTQHSQKPEAFQDTLERMFEGPYLELFARRDRVGWTCMGNQCPSTLDEDIRVSIERATQST